MRKAYFHIGFGKTGSSSLQSYLSFNPELRPPETKEKLIYCCFLKDGRVLFGDQLRQRAQQSPFNYCASVPAVAKMGGMDNLKAEVDRIYEAGYIPIFSQEDWGRRAGEFRDSNFFNKLNIHADVIVYIRPQVDWFNSAWWQWFAWENRLIGHRMLLMLGGATSCYGLAISRDGIAWMVFRRLPLGYNPLTLLKTS